MPLVLFQLQGGKLILSFSQLFYSVTFPVSVFQLGLLELILYSAV